MESGWTTAAIACTRHADPAILSNLRELLGDDLLDRPRHGRIRLENQWIHFPLKPGDLLLRMPKKFALGVALDMVRKQSSMNGQPDSFASVLEHSLGRTICRGFYFPYARKLWGLPPRNWRPHRPAAASPATRWAGSCARSRTRFRPEAPGRGTLLLSRRGCGETASACAKRPHLPARSSSCRRGSRPWSAKAAASQRLLMNRAVRAAAFRRAMCGRHCQSACWFAA